MDDEVLENEEVVLAYIAGLFDGEGSIIMNRSERRNFYLRCQLTNTNVEVLKFVQGLLGGAWVEDNRDYLGNKRCYYLRWSGQKAQEVLFTLLPYLIIKEKEAKLVADLDFCRANSGKWLDVYERENRRLVYQTLRKWRGKKWSLDLAEKSK